MYIARVRLLRSLLALVRVVRDGDGDDCVGRIVIEIFDSDTEARRWIV